jgi:hypothetical protein
VVWWSCAVLVVLVIVVGLEVLVVLIILVARVVFMGFVVLVQTGSRRVPTKGAVMGRVSW